MIKYYDGDNNYIFYCTAANLLDLEDFKKVYEEVEKETKELTLDDKAKILIKKINEVAKEQNVNIKLRR